jgi:hypothetical protein
VAIREKLHTNAQPFLEPGEQVQAAFTVQSGPSPYWSLLTYIVLFLVKLHAIVVTDRRILIIRASFWKASSLKHIESALPRATRLGPLSGLWGKLELDGRRYWCHKRFHKDAAAADALAGAAAHAGPPAALPAPPPQQAAAPPAQPAGWYDDPQGAARVRYWDGASWTQHIAH